VCSLTFSRFLLFRYFLVLTRWYLITFLWVTFTLSPHAMLSLYKIDYYIMYLDKL